MINSIPWSDNENVLFNQLNPDDVMIINMYRMHNRLKLYGVPINNTMFTITTDEVEILLKQQIRSANKVNRYLTGLTETHR